MKQSRKYLLALGSLLLIVSTLGLGLQQLTKPPVLTSNIEYMLVDWAEYYRSIEEMAQASEVDVIARGVIKDVEYEGFGITTAKSKYLFKPHWIIQGLSTARPVWVHQTGGLTSLGETYMPYSDPLMQVGDELILFLKERIREPDTYWVVGGPQGRFVVQGGRVYSIGELYESPNALEQRELSMMTTPFHTGGIRETEFYMKLHAMVSEP